MKVAQLLKMCEGKSDDDYISIGDILKEDGVIARCIWYEEDIASAIDDKRGIDFDCTDVSEKEIAEVENKLSVRGMEDGMIETGWEYIYDAINMAGIE
jgi:hypothetical protein